MARKAVQQWVAPGNVTAFALDDTIKIRSNKKMLGISSHFDHTTGRHVMGHQVCFRKSKQNLGFLHEQARHYACYIASIRLTGVRF